MADKLQDNAGARTAFVAGATGYTGQAVVRALRARGVRVFAHVRPDSPRLDEWRRRFGSLGAQTDSTPWEEDAMRATLANARPQMVFALLGTTRARVAQARTRGADDSYETVDYGLTALLLRATLAAAPSARFIYLSSLGVGPGARGAYLLARWKAEQDIRASGIEYVIARPSFITGSDREERRRLERVLGAVSNGILAVAGALGLRATRERYRAHTAAELAEALVDHAIRPESARRELDGVGLYSLAGAGTGE